MSLAGNAYGKTTILSPAYSVLSSSQYGNPYTFTGRRLDVFDYNPMTHEHGYEIMYYRARYYDTDTGRFIQRDPLGITPNPTKPNLFKTNWQYKDGLNVYGYTLSNPVNGVDAWGLTECKTKKVYVWVPIITPPYLKKTLLFIGSQDHFNNVCACNSCCDVIYKEWADKVSSLKRLFGSKKAIEVCHTLCAARRKPKMFF